MKPNFKLIQENLQFQATRSRITFSNLNNVLNQFKDVAEKLSQL